MAGKSRPPCNMPASGIPAAGIPASGIAAGGEGYGGPKKGEGTPPGNRMGGRPVGVKTGEGKHARAAEIAKGYVVEAVEVWLKVMQDEGAPAQARIAAAAHMVERAEGKPVQPTEDVTPRRRAEDMTDDELADIIAAGSGDDAATPKGRTN